MSEPTPVTDHVHACVKILNERLQARYVPEPVLVDSVGSVFELIDLPWDQHTEEDGLFREGYETCLLDVVDAIAQAWGVALPKLEVHNEPSE